MNKIHLLIFTFAIISTSLYGQANSECCCDDNKVSFIGEKVHLLFSNSDYDYFYSTTYFGPGADLGNYDYKRGYFLVCTWVRSRANSKRVVNWRLGFNYYIDNLQLRSSYLGFTTGHNNQNSVGKNGWFSRLKCDKIRSMTRPIAFDHYFAISGTIPNNEKIDIQQIDSLRAKEPIIKN